VRVSLPKLTDTRSEATWKPSDACDRVSHLHQLPMAFQQSQVQQPACIAAAADLVDAAIQHPHRRRHAKVGAQPCLRDSMCSFDSTSRFRVLPFRAAVALQADDISVREWAKQRWARSNTMDTDPRSCRGDSLHSTSGATIPLGMSWVRLGSTDLSGTSASGTVKGPAIGNVAVDLVEKRICTKMERKI